MIYCKLYASDTLLLSIHARHILCCKIELKKHGLEVPSAVLETILFMKWYAEKSTSWEDDKKRCQQHKKRPLNSSPNFRTVFLAVHFITYIHQPKTISKSENNTAKKKSLDRIQVARKPANLLIKNESLSFERKHSNALKLQHM